MASGVTTGESGSRKLSASGTERFRGGDLLESRFCDMISRSRLFRRVKDVCRIVEPLPLELPEPHVFDMMVEKLVGVGDTARAVASDCSPSASSPTFSTGGGDMTPADITSSFFCFFSDIVAEGIGSKSHVGSLVWMDTLVTSVSSAASGM
jgi:hypothetical protein